MRKACTFECLLWESKMNKIKRNEWNISVPPFSFLAILPPHLQEQVEDIFDDKYVILSSVEITEVKRWWLSSLKQEVRPIDYRCDS